ncbi:MAG: (d)CMP kinase [Bdellovibrionaceae bacterium]|nr:(d)CMP kinase [Pseudobdellovibrionaceae bacterium]
MEKIITIDGLASSGKSALSQKLSKKIGWPWFSTGVLYRGMAYVGYIEKFDEKKYLSFFKSKDWFIKLTEKKSLFFYKGEDISSKLYQKFIDEKASFFSSYTLYRKALIPVQRSFYKAQKGLILEGRDCGSILFPSAPLKIFLSAPDRVRAKRRAEDRKEPVHAVLQSQKNRDQRDQNRHFAPVIKPKNALCLNSEEYSLNQIVELVYEKAIDIFQSKT